ncbi:hypothetical protein [Bordetella genomosp. 9]|jgi:hypothetical protein|uniref:hypothetical protein n=1 Tax=Bordetella genomosp. 9 TaxID=1416803 RepID=UPI0011788490|nr:hypothetical protein [Bordetella genomosp. 9]
MEHTPNMSKDALKRGHRPMIGLRMESLEFEKCKRYAAADERSAAQFALLMYRRGLEAYEAECKKQRRRQG